MLLPWWFARRNEKQSYTFRIAVLVIAVPMDFEVMKSTKGTF
jgi:hypothetical protein